VHVNCSCSEWSIYLAFFSSARRTSPLLQTSSCAFPFPSYLSTSMSAQPQANKIPIVSSSLSPPAPFLSPAIFSPLSSLVFCSGSCGVNPKTGTILPMDQGDVKDRTKLALRSVETLLKEKGMDLGDGQELPPSLSLSLQDLLWTVS
jgi:hypothetical protein